MPKVNPRSVAIVPKRTKKPVIKKGNTVSYNPDTFKTMHVVPNFIELDDPDELVARIKPYEIFGKKIITFDSETHPYYKSSLEVPTGIVRRWVGSGKKAVPQDYPFCISICDGTNAYSIYDTIANGFAKFKKLAPLFEDPTIEKIAHNTKFDMHMFANAGLKIVGKLHDTVVLTKLADENRRSFMLRKLAENNPRGVVKFEYMVDAFKQMNKVTDYRMIPRELLTQYANADVWNCFITFVDEYQKIIDDELESLYNNETELMIALYEMERHGMVVDTDYEQPLKEELQRLTDEAESAIYKEAGRMFNINSGKQLYEVLMALGVDNTLIKRTDKGNPKLDKKALENLADNHGVNIVKNILEYRKYEKLLGTYAVGIYGQRDANHKVHGSINQTEATTGRMSITKPALQTLPKKDKRIRKAFIPEADYNMVFMDLDQVEYRIFAHYAKAEGLLKQIDAGYDVHAATAALIYRKPIDEIDPEGPERVAAKTVNFSLVYGQGNEATSQALGLTMTETIQFKHNYFSEIPEAKPFINTVHAVIKARGFVKNMYGRRRRLTTNECYKAPNALIQGCAADYIKHKLVNIYKFLKYNKYKTKMINIVHDEIVFLVHKDEMFLMPTLRWLLSDFEDYRCDITAGVDMGDPSWGEKVSQPDIDFTEPVNMDYLSHDVFDGLVFTI